MRYLIIALLLAGCSSPLPKLSVTPVSADLTVAGEVDNKQNEDNMVKLETGGSTTTEIVAERVSQVSNHVQEYPKWLILAFAMAVGLAVPSPLSVFSHWLTVRRLSRTNKQLLSLLEAKMSNTSPVTSTTKPEASPLKDSSQLVGL